MIYTRLAALGFAVMALQFALAEGQESRPLCTNGHPARRPLGITYAGLPTLHGYQRDHVRSLGLGGTDTKDNVLYQRCYRTGLFGRCESGPAAAKDADEHFAEEYLCSGRWSLDYAQQWLTARWPTDAAHGYLMESK